MAAPEPVITHGLPGLFLMSDEVDRNVDDFDHGNLEYLAPARDSLNPGFTCPEFPNLTIMSVNARSEVDEYILRCRVQGLMSGSSRRIAKQYTTNLEGLDEGAESWLVKTVTSGLQIGGVSTDHANMRVITSPVEELWGGWKRVNLRFLGSLGSKPYKRRIKVDGQTVQPSDPCVVGFTGGWFTPAKGRVELPEIVVEDTSIVTSQPNMTVIPGNETPDSPPSVVTFSLTGDLVKQWPNGWTIEDITFDPIPGTSIGPSTRIYKYKWPATF